MYCVYVYSIVCHDRLFFGCLCCQGICLFQIKIYLKFVDFLNKEILSGAQLGLVGACKWAELDQNN